MKIDETKIKWAEKRSKALRGSLLEVPNAVAALKKAAAAMKKAANGIKAYSELPEMQSYEDAISKMADDLDESRKKWEDTENDLQLGIIEFRMEVNENVPG